MLILNQTVDFETFTSQEIWILHVLDTDEWRGEVWNGRNITICLF